MPSQMILCGFELPFDELIPGFLVPIFAVMGINVVQRVGADVVCTGYQEIQVSEKYLAISTLRQVGDLSLDILCTEPLTIGDPALFVFFDGHRIYAGSHSQLLARLIPILPRLRMLLMDRRLTLASLYEFVGDAEVANQLRVNRSLAITVENENNTSIASFDGRGIAAKAAKSKVLGSHLDDALWTGLNSFCNSVLDSRQGRLPTEQPIVRRSSKARGRHRAALESAHG